MAPDPVKRTIWKDKYWRVARRTVQLAALAATLVLFTGLRVDGLPPGLANLLLKLDPLAMGAAMLASRTFVAGGLLALLTIALTLIFGRAWCGWLCPMGTTLELIPLRRGKDKRVTLPENLRAVKHILLLFVLASAAFGSLSLMFLDPLTIFMRALAEGIWPGLDTGISAVQKALYPFTPLRPALVAFDRFLRPQILPAWPVIPTAGLVSVSVFLAVIGLNFLAPQFWCRYLCPLGSLLGLISKVAVFRRRVDSSSCTDCAACARVCPTGTIDPQKGSASDPAECTMCLEGIAACPRSGQTFSAHIRPSAWNAYDPNRRRLLASIGLAAVGTALFKADLTRQSDPPHLLRPPGAKENDLLSKCIRCGDCVRACPTGAIHPAVLEGGAESFGTPVLHMRSGFCQYGCNQCGQVCPVEAIPPLVLEAKQQIVIGHAYIDTDRCLAWADHAECIVCEEMCPLPEKAIKLDGIRPVVDRNLCIGCGNCEYKCPVNGPAAIRVWSLDKRFFK